MITTYSRFPISNPNAPGFAEADYSRFKFGDRRRAAEFGALLAEGFWQAHGENILAAEEVVLLPSPFDHIPTASWFLADFFRQWINRKLYAHDRKSLLTAKIHRNKTYSADYGQLSREERLRLIQSDTYHIDKHFLAGRTCIFIDDIKITGSGEHIIRSLIKDHRIEGNFYFLYFAELVNKEVHPRYENYLNYHYVKDGKQVAELTKSPDFVFNTRVIKFILSRSVDELEMILTASTPGQCRALIDWAIGNNYHRMPEYRMQLARIVALHPGVSEPEALEADLKS